MRVRVLVNTLKDAVTIPSAAVQRGSSQGVFAWVVKSDDTVENRPIEAGPSAGDMTVVTSGLKAGERVVVSGRYRLRPGTNCRQLRNGAGCRGPGPMNISAPFIRRPVATSLLMVAIALLGLRHVPRLPVAPLPQVAFPTIRVSRRTIPPAQVRRPWRPPSRNH